MHHKHQHKCMCCCYYLHKHPPCSPDLRTQPLKLPVGIALYDTVWIIYSKALIIIACDHHKMSLFCEISRTDIYDYQIALIKPFFKCILINLYSLCIYPVVPAALAYKIPCTSGAIHTVAGLLCILCHRKRGCLCIMCQI